MAPKFLPRISQPCSQDWRAMSGDNKLRYCEHCQLNVHNLDAMSLAEQEVLLAQRGTRHCIAYVGTDRSIRVRTGTWLLIQRLLRPWRAALALVAFVLPFGTSGCATAHSPPAVAASQGTDDCKQARTLPDGKMFLGGISCEPPLWRRILFFWE